MTRRTVVLLVAASLLSLLLGVTVTAVVMSGDEPAAQPVATASPTPTGEPTPTPSASTVLPESASPSPEATTASPTTAAPKELDDAVEFEVFTWLTSPIPATWQSQDGDGDNHKFADFSNCSISASSCPSVEFISLTGGPNRVNYGTNPIGRWVRDVCPTRSEDSAKLVEQIRIDTKVATAYQLSCKGPEYYAWHVPGVLLVLTQDQGSSVADHKLVQTVLQHSTISR